MINTLVCSEKKSLHFNHFTWLLVFAILFITTLVNAQNYPTGFNQQLVANGLNKPTVLAFAPDGRLFVAQQGGALRIIKNGSLLSRPFMIVSVDSAGERGLLGIAFDPAFMSNHFLYLYFTRPNGSNNRICRFTASGDTVIPTSETLVLDLDPLSSATNHNGGTLQFGLDGKLFVGVGENANGANAQTLNNYLGKILRINSDGTVPAGNPFPGGSASQQRIWEYGMRNPYTIAVQPGTGRIFANDVGATLWEEVDECTTGGHNYGWPNAEGMSTNSNYTNPIYTYPHGSAIGQGCAITGGTFFNPTTTNYPSQYTGRYFFLDYCGDWIDMLTLSGTTATRTNFASAISGSPVGMATGPDGNLYYLSRSNNAVYKIIYTNSTSTSTVNPVADAHVRGGAYANTNHGAAKTLISQVSTGAGSNYEDYLRFDITSFNSVSSAKLRLYGGLNNTTTASIPVEVHNVTNITWIENAITWNNKPGAQAAVLATTTIAGTAKKYYEWDITNQVMSLRNSGINFITIKLNNSTATSNRAVFNSKEAPGNKPQLVVIHSSPMPQEEKDYISFNGNADENGILIYPNPVKDNFTISASENVIHEIKIYDLTGKLVFELMMNDSNKESIDTHLLSNGMYVVSLATDKGIKTHKLFVNR